LGNAKTAAEELNTAIENYDSAVQTLDDCVKGTEEYEEALRNANEAALELLKNNPELYAQGNVYRDDNGLIKIDTDKIAEKDISSFEIADSYGRARVRE
jgi:predicted RNase H-like HicB family nuclease